MKKLIIVGGGGFAKEIICLARDCGYEVVGVLDDSEQMKGKHFLNVEVLGTIEDWVNFSHCHFVVAIGSPRARKKVVDKMIDNVVPSFLTLIHPSVVMSEFVTVGKGSLVCAGSVLTAEISLGRHCILNLNVTIGHDCCINDFVTIAPMAAISGCVELGECVEIGTGAVIRQGLNVHRGGMLGMGGVLTKNIPPNMIYAGNPAKKLKELPEV